MEALVQLQQEDYFKLLSEAPLPSSSHLI